MLAAAYVDRVRREWGLNMRVGEILTQLQGVVVDYSFSEPADNLCYDDVLLQLAESGDIPCALRFWESPIPFIVLGRSGTVEDDLFTDAVMQAAVPVYRRSSGGGTVVQGPGCLNYALVIPKQKIWRDVRASYADISNWLLEGLATCGIQGTYEPISDLALNGMKFSGNAQRRGRNHILQHGTILYDFPLSKIAAWLAQPQAQPPYRADRSHEAFVTNVDVDCRLLKTSLARAFPKPPKQEPLPGFRDALDRQQGWGRVKKLDIAS